ncbi:acetyl-CoA carboxylase biotin carboxyl carrier protein [Pseudoramibacter alactolyticus]|uniref:acetyl-CoA carboxylase biotin carboxyl carrier protein n=1 Tax=Pseudoramibacter alactolyticus TaxID=113287 RepID=UPI002354D9BD|nr:acetyl-CoA carboxylase biotin carboxyl carrier protein [Pseudoramibacter alactolyticus]MBM6968722.1 acetyl-CoA carboxylase biotin carboxyl carrier protein [Pseudoramibacter alactolyticus]
MELKDILNLIDRFEQSASVSMTIKLGDDELSLKKAEAYAPKTETIVAPQPTPAAAAPAVQSAVPADDQTSTPVRGDTINAPLVGTFYHAASPDDPPYVTVGQSVKKNETIGLIEAMKMMSEVPAPFDCVIEEILVDNGQLAAYDEPLMRVRKL